MATSRPYTETGSRPTIVRWKIFWLALLVITVNYVDRASLSVAMPLIADDLQIPAAMTGVILSSFFWTYAPMQIPGGWLADRFSARWIITAATLVWGFFEFISGLAINSFWLIASRLGLGLAEAPLYPGFGKLNAIWLSSHERGRGATLIDGGAPLGTALGGVVISGLIALFGSWRMAFFVAGVATVALGLFAFWFIREQPAHHPRINAAELDYIEQEREKEQRAHKAPSISDTRLADFLRFRSFWGMCLGWLGFDVVFYGLVTWAPLYLAETQNLDISQIGGATLLIFGMGFIGELVGGWITDTWRAHGTRANVVMKTMLGISGVLTTVSVFLVGFATSLTEAVVLLSSTLFFLRWAGLYWSVPSTLTDAERAGFLGGCMNFAGNVGGIGIPIVVGMIVQITGEYFLAMMVFAAAGLLYLVSSLIIDYEHRLPV